MSSAELVTVGRVGKPHGLDGSFLVEDASAEPDRFAIDTELLVAGEPAKVVASKRARGRPVIRLDRRVPRGAALQVPRSSLAPPGEDEFYVVDLIGLLVEDETGASVGTVTDVAPGVANDVLELDSGLSLPMVEDCVRHVDLAARRIVIAPNFVGPG